MLNKKTISNFSEIKAGNALAATFKLCVPSDGCNTANFTCGDCIPTWGDPGCITGIPFLCDSIE